MAAEEDRIAELSAELEKAILAVLQRDGADVWGPDVVLTGWIVLAAGLMFDQHGYPIGCSTEIVPPDGRMSWESIIGLMRCRTLKVEAEYMTAERDD